MKSIFLLSIGFLTFCTTLHYQQTQKSQFYKTTGAYLELQGELKAIESDIKFLKEHQTQLNFLIKKGWLFPQSRLIGGRVIRQWAAPLNAVRFKVEPETIKEMEGGYAFKVSKIIIETDALLDNYIYEFAENILKNFPGILVVRKLSIHRNMISNQKKRPNFVTGELVFDWLAMKGKRDEEAHFMSERSE